MMHYVNAFLNSSRAFFKKHRTAIITYMAGCLVAAMFYFMCIHYNDSYHFSVSRNFFTGELVGNNADGLHVSAPWVQVVKFDTRPFRVCIDCSCRNTNCRLIAFNPKGWREFVKREGIKYYWFSNRLSFNSGQDHEYRGLHHILRGYAYDSKYTFLTIYDDVQ